jgi:hypothetical protein
MYVFICVCARTCVCVCATLLRYIKRAASKALELRRGACVVQLCVEVGGVRHLKSRTCVHVYVQCVWVHVRMHWLSELIELHQTRSSGKLNPGAYTLCLGACAYAIVVWAY